MAEFVCNACGYEDNFLSNDDHEPCPICDAMMDRVVSAEDLEDIEEVDLEDTDE